MTSTSATTELDARLRAAAEAIAHADGLLICAGAGMGVDSGLPDFRGPAGFWREYPALADAQLAFEEVASPATFRRDPTLAWGFYGHRLALYRRTVPHLGFSLLRTWGERARYGAFVFTSNVDGQFQTAGFDPANICECHGSVHYLQCTQPCGQSVWPADAFIPEVDEAQCRLVNALPRCPTCDALARPNVLMFSDAAWIADRTDAQQQRLAQWLAQVERPAVVEIGAGPDIPTVRRFGERSAALRHVPLIRINPRDAAVGRNGIALPMSALAALEAIARAMEGITPLP
ncbi:MAG TPA: Sir2 family NAD-dependent protein deacetylase [Burkholderiaceae bacterium]|nr:Sir2 family NAD-dependent protein deacetylase [Burkholderiaceae bacterium]